MSEIIEEEELEATPADIAIGLFIIFLMTVFVIGLGSLFLAPKATLNTIGDWKDEWVEVLHLDTK